MEESKPYELFLQIVIDLNAMTHTQIYIYV